MASFTEGGRVDLSISGLTASEIDWINTPGGDTVRTRRWESGNVPLEIEIEYNLAAERARQLDTLVALGYPHMLGLSDDYYRESFPQFSPQPEGRDAIFNVPLLVDPRPPITPDGMLVNYDDGKRSQYAIWTDRATRIGIYTGDRYRVGSGEIKGERTSRRAAMASGVPCTYFELLAMALHHPELFSMGGIIGAPASTLDGREIMFDFGHETKQIGLWLGEVGKNGLTRHSSIARR